MVPAINEWINISLGMLVPWAPGERIIRAHFQQVVKTDCTNILMVMTVWLIERLITKNENGWRKMRLTKFKSIMSKSFHEYSGKWREPENPMLINPGWQLLWHWTETVAYFIRIDERLCLIWSNQCKLMKATKFCRTSWLGEAQRIRSFCSSYCRMEFYINESMRVFLMNFHILNTHKETFSFELTFVVAMSGKK